MIEMRLFQIDQRLEYPLSSLQAGPFSIRCTYARSRETRQGDDMGQDYITYKVTDDSILFCVCDGVSQSFYGNLAAKYLGILCCNSYLNPIALILRTAKL